MIVLNPEKGSKELTSLANALKTDENIEKHAAATSLALLLVWHPADHTKPVTRILITANGPTPRIPATRAAPVQNKAPVNEAPIKKVVKQPLTGAALSRPTSAPKKPTAQPLTKPPTTPTTTNRTAHATENKVANKSGRPANDAKKTAAPTTKPKEGAKEKEVIRDAAPPPADLQPAAPPKSPEAPAGTSAALLSPQDPVSPNVPDYSPDAKSPLSPKSPDMPESPFTPQAPGADALYDSIEEPIRDAEPAAPPKSPEAPPAGSPAVVLSPQDPGSPTVPENSPDAKSFPSPKSPDMPESPFAPQVPGADGLLDGIEEPMRVRKISMDYTDEENKVTDELSKMEVETPEKGVDLLDLAPPAYVSQETPLLDSTPLSPPPFAPVSNTSEDDSMISSPTQEDQTTHHDVEEDEASSPAQEQPSHHESEEDEASKKGIIHKSSVQGMLFYEIYALLPQNVNESGDDKSRISPPSLNDIDNGALEHERDKKSKGLGFALISELLSAGAPPFTAGFVSGIVDESPTALQEVFIFF
ncbi:unnamed protein product [Gongylonema pulchrum]|uniref:BRCT domain-containing protein n=1 Tax=Gongylonema pulchrum TaxID=637853 RepID=A0A183EED6_9BILA|nr:unnamed protein product [Gongylonema pulchrum]